MYTLEYSKFFFEGILKIKEKEPETLKECKGLLERLQYSDFGISLENKHNMDLSKYKKIYFHNRKYRIIYKREADLIYICGVGLRSNLEIYKDIYKEFE